MEDLSQQNSEQETKVKQKVFLERRNNELATQVQIPISVNEESDLSNVTLEEYVNDHLELDIYLQKELSKYEPKEPDENKPPPTTTKTAVTKQPPCSARPRQPSSKVYRCHLDTCNKTYVKSSHLKVFTSKSYHTFCSSGPHPDPHWREAVPLPLDWLSVEVC